MGCGSSKSTAVAPVNVKAQVQEKKPTESRPSSGKNCHALSETDACITRSTTVSDRNDSLGSQGTPKRILVKQSSDSLRGSQDSLCDSRPNSSSKSSNARETSATSRTTADSGVCEDEDQLNMITEESGKQAWQEAAIDERPSTPELVIEGNKVNSRGSAKQHKKKSIDSNNVSVSNLPPLENKITLTNRPQSRLGNLAFDVVLCPETANVKRRPDKLAQLEMKSMERRKKKKKRSTKPLTLEEWEAKQKQAEERRKLQEEQKKEKARLSSKTLTEVTSITTDATS